MISKLATQGENTKDLCKTNRPLLCLNGHIQCHLTLKDNVWILRGKYILLSVKTALSHKAFYIITSSSSIKDAVISSF